VTVGSHTELLTPHGPSLRWFDSSRRSLAFLAVSVTEQSRHRPAVPQRRVRLPPDTLVAL